MPNEIRRNAASTDETRARPRAAARQSGTGLSRQTPAKQTGASASHPKASRSAGMTRGMPARPAQMGSKQPAAAQKTAKSPAGSQVPARQQQALSEKDREKALRKQQRGEKLKKNTGEIKEEFKNLTGYFNKDAVRPDDIVRVRGGIDRPMLIIILILVCFGSVMVFTSSYAFAFSKFGDSYYFIRRQLVFALLGIAAMLGASFFDYRIIRKLSRLYFIVVGLLLVAVLFKGSAEGEARRWLYLGFFAFQPSEFMKLGLAMTLADYYQLAEKQARDKRFWVSSVFGTFIPVALLAVVCALIVLENHISGTIIMFGIGLLIIFCAGGKLVWLLGVGGGFAVIVTAVITATGYATKRLDIWLHPENYSAQSEVWQTLQGLYAVGSGGMLGVGLGESRQKHLFVSQPQNDFIFSIICEELGFVGAVIVLLLFAVFVWRGFTIAMKAPDTFSKLTVIGIVGKVGIQALLNIAVVTASIPNTGVTLPFFSYGGSSLSILLLEMGIVLAISRYSIEQK